jgi:hypothetical protein
MTDNSMRPLPGGQASPAPAVAQRRGAALAAVAILAGCVILGIIGGVIWAALAPRVLYQMYSLNPPTAYAVNPETSAFIAADGWYCLIAVAGGTLAGLLGYFLGVRRYGPVPMVAIVAGAVAAGFLMAWLGHRWSGGPGFNHLLATSKPGAYLHQPISLGARGAIAFWPLAGAAVAGALELFGVMRTQHEPAYGTPMPGMDSFGFRPAGPGQELAAPSGPVAGHAPGAGQDMTGQLHGDSGEIDPGR